MKRARNGWRKRNKKKISTGEAVCVYFKLLLPHASRLECVERVYFSHLISFDAIATAAAAVAVACIEIG